MVLLGQLVERLADIIGARAPGYAQFLIRILRQANVLEHVQTGRRAVLAKTTRRGGAP
jgi:hypothetical protein